jgi:hypothetical protein
VRSLTRLENRIPPNAVVSAWYLVVPHVDHRTQIYLWPTPFETQNYGLFNNDGVRLPVASKVQYLVLPVALDSEDDSSVFASISKNFTLVTSDAGVGLYKRIKR